MSYVFAGNMQRSIAPLHSFNNPRRFPQPMFLSGSVDFTITPSSFISGMTGNMALLASAALDVTTPTAVEILGLFDTENVKDGLIASALLSNVGAEDIGIVGGTGVTIEGNTTASATTSYIITVYVEDSSAGAEAVTLIVS